MKVKDLVRNLHDVNPEADVVMWASNTEDKNEVFGFAVADNDDDIITEIALCDKESHRAFTDWKEG